MRSLTLSLAAVVVALPAFGQTVTFDVQPNQEGFIQRNTGVSVTYTATFGEASVGRNNNTLGFIPRARYGFATFTIPDSQVLGFQYTFVGATLNLVTGTANWGNSANRTVAFVEITDTNADTLNSGTVSSTQAFGLVIDAFLGGSEFASANILGNQDSTTFQIPLTSAFIDYSRNNVGDIIGFALRPDGLLDFGQNQLVNFTDFFITYEAELTGGGGPTADQTQQNRENKVARAQQIQLMLKSKLASAAAASKAALARAASN